MRISKNQILEKMKPNTLFLLAHLTAFALWLTPLTAFTAESEKARDAEEEKEYLNWIEFGFGGADVSGDRASFQRRMNVRRGVFGGISDFHYEQEIKKIGTLKLDGRGIFDNHDYKLRLDMDFPEKGYIRAGFSEARYWYDGSGGFHPNLPWSVIYDDNLRLDRREIWVEAGLRFPDLPQVTFRYERHTREGQKDSTSWGASPAGIYGMRNIIPSFLGIDETRDVFMLDLSHKIKATEIGLGARYDTQDIDNKRFERIFVGTALDRHITTHDYLTSDMFNIHAYSKTWLNKDKTLFTMGYSFTDMDTDTAGYRRYGNFYDPDFANRLPHFESFENMVGGSLLKQHVASVNLMHILKDNLTLTPSIRIENRDIDSVSYFSKPSLGGGAPWSDATAWSQRSLIDVSERLELKYTGITNWVFYARGDWLQGTGDLDERLTGDPLPLLNNVDRSTDDERFMQKYTVGFNWYPIRRFSVSSEYYHKNRINKYDRIGYIPPLLPVNLYPNYIARQEFDTDDVNLRLTWRPLNNLTLVGRYDFQLSTIDNRAYDNLGDIQTAEITSHILSGSITWSPFNRLWLQGSVSYSMDKTDTLADTLTGAAYGLVLDARNNYWNTTISAGYALTQKADFETSYSYYRADNGQNNAIWGLPLGSNAKEHSVTAGIVYRFSSRMRWNIKYGYYDYTDALAGKNNDYSAHMVFSTIQMRF